MFFSTFFIASTNFTNLSSRNQKIELYEYSEATKSIHNIMS